MLVSVRDGACDELDTVCVCGVGGGEVCVWSGVGGSVWAGVCGRGEVCVRGGG